MASDRDAASRETARAALALLAIAGFVLVAVALPAVGGEAPGRSLLPEAADGTAQEGNDALAGGGDDSSLVDGLFGALARQEPADAGRDDTGNRDSGQVPGVDRSGFGALNPGARTGVGSTGNAVSESLRSQSTTPHFTVRSSEPAYWRTGAYERYTGEGWDATDDAGEVDWPRQVGPAPGDRRTVVQQYRLHRSASALPAAAQPADVGPEIAGEVRLTGRGALRMPARLGANESYTVTSRAPPRDPDRLRAAGEDYPASVQRYATLEEGTADRLAEFTDGLTADADSPYETAVEIERWLEANKEYSLDASHDGGDVAESFVFGMERGYCEYFATAMTVMLRTQDIPARYVVGYSTGEPVGNDTYLVRAMNAHAWVEVYFPDTGWVRFDPTPGRDRLAAEARAYRQAAEAGDATNGAEQFGDRAGQGSGASPFRQVGGRSGGAGGGQSGDTGGSDGPGDRPQGDGQSDGTSGGGDDTGGQATADRYNHSESGSPDETFDPSGEADYRISLRDDPVPGEPVTVLVERGTDPAAGVAVQFNGRRVGTTNASGLIQGVVPFTDNLIVNVTGSGATGALLAGPALRDGPAIRGRPASHGGMVARVEPTVRTSGVAAQADGTNVTRTFDVPTNVTVAVAGDPDPGETATVVATIDGRPVSGANVAVDGEQAGETDRDGRATVALPGNETATVTVTRGDASGTRRLSLANVSVTVTGTALPGLSVTVAVTDGGDPVSGATVAVGGEVATTGPDGRASVRLPLAADATVRVETPGGVTEREPVTMQVLPAAVLLAIVLGAVAALVVLRRRAVAAGRSIRDQLVATVRQASAALVAALVALAARAERLTTLLPELARRLRSRIEATRRALAALGEREVDLPTPRALLSRLLAAVAALVRGAQTWLPGEPDRAADGDASTVGAGGDDAAASPRERVRRAWREYRRQVPVADYRPKTPGELARDGIEAGHPPPPVRTLRDAVRDVEYGERDPGQYVEDVATARRRLRSHGERDAGRDDRTTPNGIDAANARDREAADRTETRRGHGDETSHDRGTTIDRPDDQVEPDGGEQA